MNKENIKQNIKYSAYNYIAINLLRFVVRIAFISNLSIEYLGINGLFTNILAVLSLAELGVGPAIVYSLYKPLALEDRKTVKAIMVLFKKFYVSIGVIILLAGICLYPWLDFFIKNGSGIAELKYFYLVFLLNTSVSYFWSYHRNLLIADQKQYFVNIYQAYSQIIVSVAQIVFLYVFHNYWAFVLLMLGGTVLENVIIARKSKQEYPYLNEEAGIIDKEVKSEIIKNTKAMIVHKVGTIAVFSSSNLILSKFVGLAAVGLYSNYNMITTALNNLAGKLFEAVTASIGNMMVVADKAEQQKAFKFTEFITAYLASIMSVGLYVMFNDFITLWIGKDYCFDNATVTAIVIYFYVMFMRKTVLMFRDACGLFYMDRYKPIAETIINLVASIYLAIHYGTIGVICGGIISTMLTCFWVEPFIVLRYGLDMPLKRYFREYFGYTGVTAFCAIFINNVYHSMLKQPSILGFCLGMVFVVLMVSVAWYFCYRKRAEMQMLCNAVKKKLGLR